MGVVRSRARAYLTQAESVISDLRSPGKPIKQRESFTGFRMTNHQRAPWARKPVVVDRYLGQLNVIVWPVDFFTCSLLRRRFFPGRTIRFCFCFFFSIEMMKIELGLQRFC